MDYWIQLNVGFAIGEVGLAALFAAVAAIIWALRQ
jgi:hypothetical protein